MKLDEIRIKKEKTQEKIKNIKFNINFNKFLAGSYSFVTAYQVYEMCLNDFDFNYYAINIPITLACGGVVVYSLKALKKDKIKLISLNEELKELNEKAKVNKKSRS